MGLFADWQPRYAEVGIASFPVQNKRPRVKGYLNTDLRRSRAFVGRYGDAGAFGIPLARSGIAVLDVDTSDERVLADAMALAGPTRFIVRSGSGNWQAWYKASGEGRRIRPDPDMPVDVLGDGFVVAPPSQGSKGAYAIVEGCLDDLASLPAMQTDRWSNLPTYNLTPLPSASPLPLSTATAPAAASRPLEGVAPGARNDSLWKYLMTQAPHCDDANALIDVAQGAAAAFASPLSDDEVVKTALSAWKYEREGRNWIGRPRLKPPASEPRSLLYSHPDAFILWNVLQDHNAQRPWFLVANAMAETMSGGGWTVRRFAAARKVLLEGGHITEVRKAYTGSAARFAWGRQ